MNKKYFIGIVPAFICGLINLTSCSLINPPVVVPCYGKVDSISYTYMTEGTNSAGITDAWVYLDDNPVGAFELPCKFPIVASNGVHQITIFAGIKEDGSSATRTKYPLFTTYTTNVNLQQGSIITFKPTGITYASFAHFHWEENFESGISITKIAAQSDTDISTTTVGAFSGHSGIVALDSNNPTYYHQEYTGATDTMILAKDGATPVYLEINYNCNNIFSVGLCAGTLGNMLTPIVFVYPTNGAWKKMYISLEPTIATSGQSIFYIYFQMFRSKGNANAVMMLDNLRVVD